jgi:DNA polymerase-3 subunit delta'
LEPKDISQSLRSLGESFAALPEPDVQRAISHADGSVRRAIEMLDPRKAETVETVTELLSNLPRVDLKRVHALAERLARKGNEPEFGLALEAVERWVSETMNARAAFGAARLAPLLAVCEKITRAAREADIYNLDRRPLVLTLFGDLAEAVRALR